MTVATHKLPRTVIYACDDDFLSAPFLVVSNNVGQRMDGTGAARGVSLSLASPTRSPARKRTLARVARCGAPRGLRGRHILPMIAARKRERRNRSLGRWRGVVERTFAWMNQFCRLRIPF